MRDKLQSKECARVLKALADPDRLRIIQCLQAGPRNVSQMAEELQADLANVSHHLGVLRNAGLVQDEKQGKYVLYTLHPDVFQADAEVADLGCCRLELGRKDMAN
jgi:DNA-binding transcriptional ArsR family regulator